MRRTLARATAIGALVFALAAVIVGTVVTVTQGDRIQPGTIVAVGDPTTPAMQEVLGELQVRAANGDDLRTSLETTVTGRVTAGAEGVLAT